MNSRHPGKLLFTGNDDLKTSYNGQYHSILVIAFLYAIILFSLSIVHFANDISLTFSIPLYVSCIFTIGWAQYSIGNGMHEAVHRNLLNRKGDFWVSVVVAYPIGLTMQYRNIHLLHHQYIGTNKDPDWGQYHTFPASKIAFFKKLFWSASGMPAILQFLRLQVSKSKSGGNKHLETITFILVQFSIFAVFVFMALQAIEWVN